jgi:hypothetical protein
VSLNLVVELASPVLVLTTNTGTAGPCTQAVGILSYTEVQQIISDPANQVTVTFDQEAAVKIAVFQGNQWVGYDDVQTLALKQAYANSHCIGGYVFPCNPNECSVLHVSNSLLAR